jgi:hypothetical protein
MSIDLDILATTSELICWGNLKKRLQELLSPVEVEFLGKNPALLHLGSNKVLAEDEKLSLNDSYYLSLEIANTLSITVMPNEGNLNELEYLEDYGRNLEPEDIKRLAARWQAVGHYYGITSLAGRSKPESKLFIALATAVAYNCFGYVIVMNNDILDLKVGVYTPEHFQNAQPNF